eukprot:525630-Rhodomonas_salina.2
MVVSSTELAHLPQDVRVWRPLRAVLKERTMSVARGTETAYGLRCSGLRPPGSVSPHPMLTLSSVYPRSLSPTPPLFSLSKVSRMPCVGTIHTVSDTVFQYRTRYISV